MPHIRSLSFALLFASAHATQPKAQAQQLRASPNASVQKADLSADSHTDKNPTLKALAPPTIAFRTGADGVTRPLNVVAGQTVKLSDDGFTLDVENVGDQVHFPKKGDSVTVHYVGWLNDGTVFDSSRERNEPITFPIGLGKVIRGWDQGIITMSLGERALLHVPSYKGYGTNGAPPAIPPKADLHFDVEVLAVNDVTVPGFKLPKGALAAAKAEKSGSKGTILSTLGMCMLTLFV
mmetsp:Transcript_96213/g.151557  ORF Transcript_96213/g.151557 Transcript_96213/m.151557 type:complete len:236 (+) Transcript_96213:74-781(+)